MFGAMDGAMKFVKGDSIAGIIVAVVNILGGTLIGVTQEGISAGEALQLYGILTIGDGLVSQIPSLLVAISAGILVTRSGSDAGNVGAQIGGQIFAQPKALLVAACLIFLFALIPGFPKVQLFALALALGGIGYTLKSLDGVKDAPDYREELTKTMKPATGAQKAARPGAQKEEFSPVVPIILDVSPQLLESLDYEALNNELSALRRALYFDLGVPFPGINIRPNPNLTDLSYLLLMNEIPISRGRFEPGSIMVGESLESLQMLRLTPKEGHAFLPNTPSLWLPESDAELLTRAGLSYMTHPRLLAWHLSLVLSRYASSFIGLQETKFLLDKMEERAPDLVREATRLMPIQRLSDIFQRLVSEQISIRDLRGILEAVIEWAPKEKDVIMLVEYVRGALKRQISYHYASGQNILSAFLLDPALEETIRKSVRQTSVGAFLSLPPDVSKRFLDAVGAALGKFAKGRGQKPVLLASIDIRRYLRRLVEAEYYELAVLSFQELTPEISVQPVDKILL
jgi:type III secretion protein V